jgi:hypothetical protein
MKYIKQFIKTLSDKVEIKENEKSNSTYCIIDDTFVVRLSDHLSPSDARTGININVVSIWKNPNFVVIYRNTLNPMLMDRKEVKAYIAFCYNNWQLENITNKSRDKWTKATGGLTGEDKYVYGISERYPTIKVYKDWKQLHSTLGSVNRFKPINKDVRKVFEIYFCENKINGEDILRLIYEKINGTTEKDQAIDIIEKYIKEKPKVEKGIIAGVVSDGTPSDVTHVSSDSVATHFETT